MPRRKDDIKEIEVEVVPPGKSPERTGAGVPKRENNDDPFIAFMARLMDTQFAIPGTNIRFGLDPIMGLIPGVGDSAGAVVSAVLIFQSARYGVPRIVLARMAMNVVLNTLLGAVPVVGDGFSVFFKSNARNYALLRKHATAARTKPSTGDYAFVFGLIGAVMLALVLAIVGMVFILRQLFGA